MLFRSFDRRPWQGNAYNAPAPGPAPPRASTFTFNCQFLVVTPSSVYLRIDHVTKRFGETVAVNDVSLDIERGEIFALLGSSGCGKSTLLRVLSGFETPTRGKVWLDGRDVTALPPYERPMNMMFQSYALFPHLNVWDNVAFGLKRDGVPKAEMVERVEDMLALVQLQKIGRAHV